MEQAGKDFIERMGVLAERDGAFSRIAGRMLGYFMLTPDPKTLDEIAEELQISKASASTNARFLENMGLLERRGTFGDRRDFYRLGDAPWENLFSVIRRRMEETAHLLAQTTDRLPAEMGTARNRLALWSDFYRFMLEDLDDKAERWRRRIEAQAAVIEKE